MKFIELDEQAKGAARDWWREASCDAWWDEIFDDAVTVGKLIGIEIFMRYHKNSDGQTLAKPNIRFNGFSLQGSGCCFDGALNILALEGCSAKVQAYAGKDEKIANLALRGEAIYQDVLLNQIASRLCGEEWESNFVLDVTGNERGYSSRVGTYESGCHIPPALEDNFNEYLANFASWIYGRLEAESDYLDSDEYIADAINANDYSFDEFGSIL